MNSDQASFLLKRRNLTRLWLALLAFNVIIHLDAFDPAPVESQVVVSALTCSSDADFRNPHSDSQWTMLSFAGAMGHSWTSDLEKSLNSREFSTSLATQDLGNKGHQNEHSPRWFLSSQAGRAPPEQA